MRVIGGTARGRRLRAPSSDAVRPTSDRAREAIFNALGALGAVDGARVLDLFCGSGALGIEALSRGAAAVTFVDADRLALASVTANLEAVGFGARHDAVRIVRSDALGYLVSGPTFDLALVDPPYQFDRWSEVLERLDAETVVIESDRPIDVGARWRLHRSYRYGSTLVHIVQRHLMSGADTP
jgi:16S rRNA (guanine966-N2)-methyltransferase